MSTISYSNRKAIVEYLKIKIPELTFQIICVVDTSGIDLSDEYLDVIGEICNIKSMRADYEFDISVTASEPVGHLRLGFYFNNVLFNSKYKDTVISVLLEITKQLRLDFSSYLYLMNNISFKEF